MKISERELIWLLDMASDYIELYKTINGTDSVVNFWEINLAKIYAKQDKVLETNEDHI